MSRRTRSFLPCKDSLYRPKLQESVVAQVATKRKLAKKYFDRNARPLPELVVRQPVRAKTRPKDVQAPWTPALVTAPPSYLIETADGRLYRRNRVHLRDTIQTSQVPPPELAIDTSDRNSVPDNTSVTPSSPKKAASVVIPKQPTPLQRETLTGSYTCRSSEQTTYEVWRFCQLVCFSYLFLLILISMRIGTILSYI